MSVTTLSPHLVAVVRTALADKTPMAAIAREHNISVHQVRRIRDETTGVMTREQANLWVLGVFAKWNSARLDEVEQQVNCLLSSAHIKYDRKELTAKYSKERNRKQSGFILNDRPYGAAQVRK